jgi:hypothetical protein
MSRLTPEMIDLISLEFYAESPGTVMFADLSLNTSLVARLNILQPALYIL